MNLHVSVSFALASVTEQNASVYGRHISRTDISGISHRRNKPGSNPSVREDFCISESCSDLDVVNLRTFVINSVRCRWSAAKPAELL